MLQANFHGINYINLIYIYLLLLYNSSILEIEHSSYYITLGLPQTKWISDNQHCCNIYIYIYIYIYVCVCVHGSTLSIVMDDEMNTRLVKVISAFAWLNRNVWNWRGILRATKIKVYRAVILTTLFYGCDMGTTFQQHIKKLKHFHMTKVLTQASLPSIYTILMQSQLHWAGHVVYL